MSNETRPMDVEKIRRVRELLRVLEREIDRPFDGEDQCCGLTPAQCHTLLEVGKRGEVSLVDLAAAFGLDASTLSRSVQSLVAAGLLARSESEKDRRYVAISLTGRGRKAYDRIETTFNDYFARVFEGIPEDKRDAVLDAVERLAESVRRLNGPPGCCPRSL